LALNAAQIFDIGGGSTEVIWTRRAGDGAPAEVVASESLPVGVINPGEDRPWRRASTAQGQRLRAAMTERLVPVRARMDAIAPSNAGTHHLLGTPVP